MKSLGKISLIFMLLTLCLISCRRDADNDGPTTTIPIDAPNISVNASVFGIVKDEHGDPVQGANIEVDGALVSPTNEDGAFKTGTIELNQLGSNVVVSKDGFFLGSKFVQPRNGQQVYVEFQLVKRSLSGSFSAETGSEITTNGSAKIQFGSGVIQDASGNAYSGNVNVYAHWFDPSSPDVMSTMPGDLRAVDSDQEFQQLGTYGMMAVELEDDNGNALNVLDGEEVGMTFPIPESMQSNAPTSIPLWFFDEDSGYWLEDGEAQLIDGIYHALVSHFTYWNCDIPENFIELTGRVLNSNGNPLSYTQLKFTTIDAMYGYAYVNGDGTFSLKVPKNADLLMEAFDYCGNIFYSQDIGPFAVDTDLPDVVITVDIGGWIEITGQLLTCNGDPLTNGYLKVSGENGHYNLVTPDDNGQITTQYINCNLSTELTLLAFDFDDNRRSDEILLPLPSSGSTSFGTIATCNVNPEFFDFEFNSSSFSVLEFDVVVDGGPIIEGFGGADSTYVNLYLLETPLNTIINPQWMQLGGLTANGNFFNLSCQGCQEMEVTLTQTATAAGEFYIGTFQGQLFNQNTLEDVSGEFKVQLD